MKESNEQYMKGRQEKLIKRDLRGMGNEGRYQAHAGHGHTINTPIYSGDRMKSPKAKPARKSKSGRKRIRGGYR